MPRVTLSDVATKCGVSRATVSLVLQDSKRVSEPTKQRVRSVLAEMGYVYNRQAASLRMDRSFTLGLVLTDIHNPALAALAMAVERVADEAGCVLMMGYSSDSLERQTRILQTMMEYRLDGIVISPSSNTTARSLQPLAQSGVPHALVTRRILDYSSDYVGPDNFAAGELLAEHLADIGAKSVAFLGGSIGVSARDEREGGLRTRATKRGIVWRPDLSIASRADDEGGATAVRQLLGMGPVPDAIVGYSDTVVRGALGELRRHSIRPGRDVAIVSFDNSPEAKHMHPALTSVDTYMSEVGEGAARQVLERINEPDRPTTSRMLQPTLNVRASSQLWVPGSAPQRPTTTAIRPL